MRKKYYFLPHIKHINNTKHFWIYLIIGLTVGFINGFFGGGGGMIVVPLLIFALGLRDKTAHATALLIILPLCMVSSIVYICNGVVDWGQTLFVGIGACIGGLIGASLLKKLSNKAIRIIFSIIMLIAGIKMII